MKCMGNILFLAASLTSFGQQGPINILRYLDDFSYLQDSDTLRRNWYEKLKFISLGQKSNVSFGGEIREMYQYFKNQNFGDVPPFFDTDTEGFLWHRVMAHADLRLGARWRLFTQLNSTFTLFKDNPLTDQIDENRLSLHQAFIRYTMTGNSEFLQVGRQEFGRGTQLIIGMREGPNTRLTFDALLFASERAHRRIYSFIATPVISKTGVFDDGRIEEYIWTLYVVNPISTHNLDLYYFGFYGTERAYGGVEGVERRQTIGFRFWKESRKVNYSFESNYQFGSFNDLGISAYSISFQGDYRLIDSIASGLMFNYLSGDQDSTDGRLNTYNLLYSKPQFGLAAPIGSTNIINCRPYLSLYPFPEFRVTLSNYWIWRESAEDGIYTPAAVQIRPGNGSISTNRYFGTQTAIELFYNVDTNLQFFLDYAIFHPGPYVRETGNGETLQYLSLKTSFKF